MKTLVVAATLAASLAALPAFAAGTPIPTKTTGAAGPAAPPPQQLGGKREEIREQMREKVQGKIQAYLTQNLTQRLSLDAGKSQKLADAIKAHMGRKHDRMKRLHEEMQKLQGLVDNKAPDAQVKQQLDVVLGASSRDDDVQAFVADTQKFLSVQEQAKLALALPDLLKDVHKMMRQARRDMRGGGGGFGGKHGGTNNDEE